MLNASILNVPARMASPPRSHRDRLMLYPTHLDPLVAVSVRGIFATGREFDEFEEFDTFGQGQLQFDAMLANVTGPVIEEPVTNSMSYIPNWEGLQGLSRAGTWTTCGVNIIITSTQCTVFSYTSLFVRNGALAPLYPNNYIEYISFFFYSVRIPRNSRRGPFT